jgi:hypothetical protein
VTRRQAALRFELYWTARCNVDLSLRTNPSARYKAICQHVLRLFESGRITSKVAVSILLD